MAVYLSQDAPSIHLSALRAQASQSPSPPGDMEDTPDKPQPTIIGLDPKEVDILSSLVQTSNFMEES